MTTIILMFFYVFFHERDTTEFYTYWTHSFPTRRSSDLPSLPAWPRSTVRSRARSSSSKPSRNGRSRTWSRPRNRRSPATTATSAARSEEHTSELQSLMRISYAVFCLKKKNQKKRTTNTITHVPPNQPTNHYEYNR